MPNGILLSQNKLQQQLQSHNDTMNTIKVATPIQYAATDDGPPEARLAQTKQQTITTMRADGSQSTNNGDSSGQQGGATANVANILNVAEMLLHGVADNEILEIWLKSIMCQEFVGNFIDAGYDMPTISRITPQDLTAIGITDPTKRLKILSEIKKLNLQDGIPNFRPANLNHWLNLVRLDSFYYKSLCDQQIDTIEKMCQLTWEDFEELGISKLGHQKRLQLAIERIKELESNERNTEKRVLEPIYDTNPSQILLVASSENHTTNGPVINKQSSTSELSSTGSGSMHSIYSANSSHYQPAYSSIPPQQQMDKTVIQQRQQQQQYNQNILTNHQMQPKSQPIYSQPPAQLILQQQHYQDRPIQSIPATPSTLPENSQQQHRQQSHYQAVIHQNQLQQISAQLNPAKFSKNFSDNGLNGSRNTMVPHLNRQSLGQLPSIALANLPKHQQKLLQQSSIYATLSRQPQRVKQPPPPVPIRTNSLKSNSSVDDVSGINSNSNYNKQQRQQQQQPQTSQLHNYYTQQLNNFHTSTNSLFRSGTRVSSKNNGGSQTMLTKNKSFSGNAHMDVLRARFLNRNSQQLPRQVQSIVDQTQIRTTNTNNILGNPTNNNDNINSNNRLLPDPIYGVHSNGFGVGYNIGEGFLNGHFAGGSQDGDSLSLHSRQSAISMTNALQQATNNLYNEHHFSSNLQSNNKILQHQQQPVTKSQINCPSNGTNLLSKRQQHTILPTSGDNNNFDLHSDTNSTKSLIIPSIASSFNGALDSNSRASDSPGQDSGSSQTLYNSASSGSGSSGANDQNGCYSQAGSGFISRQSTASSSTLNDINLTLDHHNHPVHNSAAQQQQLNRAPAQSQSSAPLASTGLESNKSVGSNALNATTGKDDDFPPPPSPLSLADLDEHEQRLGSVDGGSGGGGGSGSGGGGGGGENSDGQFTSGIIHGLMTFKVGS